jgi:hypothetical protein
LGESITANGEAARMKKSIGTLIIIIAIGITGYLLYNPTKSQERTSEIVEREVQQQKIEALEEQVFTLQEELAAQEDKIVPKEKLAEVYGDTATTVTPETTDTSCEDIKRNLTAFFNHLDRKGYPQFFEIEKSSYELFKKIVAQLSEATPTVTGELVELPILMSNMAYFYRRLGKKQVDLIGEILKSESEISESVLSTFYHWALSCKRCSAMAEECPSLETLYEYAGFFLNTLAGRSYLMRRNSRQRLLITYYSILILDKANEETVNRYGIDILPHLDFLASEINGQRELVHKKQYLAKLDSLKEKYQTP